MTVLKEALAKVGVYPTIHCGEVWKASDSAIELLTLETRHWHDERYCVVLSNDECCADKNIPYVLIVPLTHYLTPCPKTDLRIKETQKNGLEVDSRLILSHIQPVRKTDLIEKRGEISKGKWEQVVRQIFWQIDRGPVK